jgi:hypothetical protein
VSSTETRVVERAIRADQDLRESVSEQINSLASGEALHDLVQQAATVVRSTVLGGLADLRHDPLNAPAWAEPLSEVSDLDGTVDWTSLGENLLFEVGTKGAIADV